MNFTIFANLILLFLKDKIKYILQKSLGFNTYLFVFALFKIRTIKSDPKEKDFFHFLDQIKPEEGEILDIGANIGIMSYHLAKRFPSVKIHSFEPIPQNLTVLRKVISKFNLSNVVVHPIALGLEKGKAKMILPQQNKVLFQGLSHVKHESITEYNEGIEFNVEMNSLDNLFQNKTISAIKIDVENFEYFVLKGGEELIYNNKPVIYAELWENENRTNCFNLLTAMNYKTFVIQNKELLAYNPNKHKSQNFIFIAN